LIHKPSVLFLDEPTTGVDPVSRKEFWIMLQRLKAQGITILVSTPYMDEASLCDRIALMKDGRFLSTDTPKNIVLQYTGTLWAIRSSRMSHLLNDLRHYPLIESCFAFGDTHHVRFKANTEPDESLMAYLIQLEHKDVQYEPIQPVIEDCFMRLASTEN